MTLADCLAVEPWKVRETKLDLRYLAETESIFALSNGHIGWRANLDEGEPHVTAGSYLNAFYEAIPLPYAETAFGYPEAVDCGFPSGVISATKRLKKSSAILRAVPSIRREPICASLPPTCACTP